MAGGIALAAAEPLTPPASVAARQGETHHAAVDAARAPWSSLAKLFNSVGGSCTGAVIGAARVLTAGHCVYAFRTRRFLLPEAVHVLVGYDRGAYRTHARVVRYRLGPGYDPEAERRTAASDWAVLELAEPLPPDVRPLRLARPLESASHRTMLAGFARDRAFVLTVDDDCRITGRIEPGGLVSHDCAVQPGDSGAPLLQYAEPGGEPMIVGIAVGIWHFGTSSVGVAALAPLDLPGR